MLSYRYMSMNMEDLRKGNDDVSVPEVLEAYMVTPVKMPMRMHMLGAMYAPTDRLTLMGMVSVVSMEMDHITRMGMTFTTESSGFGDVQLSGLYKFFNKNHQVFHGKLGLSLPTGSIQETDVTPASSPDAVILPYPMQLGSGTLDLSAGLTYLWQDENLSGGHQLNGLFRTGKNNKDYRLGNRYGLQNWVAYKVLDWLSFSARVEGLLVSKLEGANPDLNPMMVITADTANFGGTYVNGGLGFNVYVPKGALKNMRFGFEIAQPLLQDVEGVQLKRKESLVGGVQYAF